MHTSINAASNIGLCGMDFFNSVKRTVRGPVKVQFIIFIRDAFETDIFSVTHDYGMCTVLVSVRLGHFVFVHELFFGIVVFKSFSHTPVNAEASITLMRVSS